MKQGYSGRYYKIIKREVKHAFLTGIIFIIIFVGIGVVQKIRGTKKIYRHSSGILGRDSKDRGAR